MERQKSFIQIGDPESCIPSNYILRKIDKAVDFSFFNRLVADSYSDDPRGQPPVMPEKVLRLLLIAYLYDLSIRAVCRESRMHAGYQWFCGFSSSSEVPDHSTISKLKNERWAQLGHGLWVETFNEVVDRCIQVGLVSGKHLATDGTSVRADVSITSYEALKPVRTVEEFADQMEAELSDKEPTDTPPSFFGRRGEKDFRGQKLNNSTHYSTTDPDALLYRKAKGQEAHPRYIGQDTIDLKSRVILATGMYQARSSSEPKAALEQLDRILGRFDLEIETLSADKLYGSTAMLRETEQRAVTLHAPLLAGDEPEAFPVYQRAARKANLIQKRQEKIHAIALRNTQRQVQKTKAFALSQRLRIRIEHIFAEAKEHHGLRRSRYRTLLKQQEQANLTAMVQNLKRLVSFIGRSRPVAIALTALKTDLSHFKALLRHLEPIFQPVICHKWVLTMKPSFI
jgi:transposase